MFDDKTGVKDRLTEKQIVALYCEALIKGEEHIAEELRTRTPMSLQTEFEIYKQLVVEGESELARTFDEKTGVKGRAQTRLMENIETTMAVMLLEGDFKSGSGRESVIKVSGKADEKEAREQKVFLEGDLNLEIKDREFRAPLLKHLLAEAFVLVDPETKEKIKDPNQDLKELAKTCPQLKQILTLCQLLEPDNQKPTVNQESIHQFFTEGVIFKYTRSIDRSKMDSEAMKKLMESLKSTQKAVNTKVGQVTRILETPEEEKELVGQLEDLQGYLDTALEPASSESQPSEETGSSKDSSVWVDAIIDQLCSGIEIDDPSKNQIAFALDLLCRLHEENPSVGHYAPLPFIQHLQEHKDEENFPSATIMDYFKEHGLKTLATIMTSNEIGATLFQFGMMIREAEKNVQVTVDGHTLITTLTYPTSSLEATDIYGNPKEMTPIKIIITVDLNNNTLEKVETERGEEHGDIQECLKKVKTEFEQYQASAEIFQQLSLTSTQPTSNVGTLKKVYDTLLTREKAQNVTSSFHVERLAKTLVEKLSDSSGSTGKHPTAETQEKMKTIFVAEYANYMQGGCQTNPVDTFLARLNDEGDEDKLAGIYQEIFSRAAGMSAKDNLDQRIMALEKIEAICREKQAIKDETQVLKENYESQLLSTMTSLKEITKKNGEGTEAVDRGKTLMREIKALEAELNEDKTTSQTNNEGKKQKLADLNKRYKELKRKAEAERQTAVDTFNHNSRQANSSLKLKVEETEAGLALLPDLTSCTPETVVESFKEFSAQFILTPESMDAYMTYFKGHLDEMTLDSTQLAIIWLNLRQELTEDELTEDELTKDELHILGGFLHKLPIQDVQGVLEVVVGVIDTDAEKQLFFNYFADSDRTGEAITLQHIASLCQLLPHAQRPQTFKSKLRTIMEFAATNAKAKNGPELKDINRQCLGEICACIQTTRSAEPAEQYEYQDELSLILWNHFMTGAPTYEAGQSMCTFIEATMPGWKLSIEKQKELEVYLLENDEFKNMAKMAASKVADAVHQVDLFKPENVFALPLSETGKETVRRQSEAINKEWQTLQNLMKETQEEDVVDSSTHESRVPSQERIEQLEEVIREKQKEIDERLKRKIQNLEQEMEEIDSTTLTVTNPVFIEDDDNEETSETTALVEGVVVEGMTSKTEDPTLITVKAEEEREQEIAAQQEEKATLERQLEELRQKETSITKDGSHLIEWLKGGCQGLEEATLMIRHDNELCLTIREKQISFEFFQALMISMLEDDVGDYLKNMRDLQTMVMQAIGSEANLRAEMTRYLHEQTTLPVYLLQQAEIEGVCLNELANRRVTMRTLYESQ
ncbi:MAG: hypothetical protein VW378_05800 [bacterium]